MERRHSRLEIFCGNPYLFLHDVQSVWLDLEALDLLKYVMQEDRQPVVIPSDDKVSPERMRCIVVRKSREIGVVREFSQGIANEVREEPKYRGEANEAGAVQNACTLS